MEAIVLAIIVTATILGLVLVDILALRFGADSRAAIGDDHAPSLGIR